ncbi:MAG: sugar phosphate isomerase/epimerase family protein [Planctomycetota bacterium]
MAFRFTGFADEAGPTIEEQIRATQEAGWDGIELRGVAGDTVTSISDDDWARTWGALQTAGIRVAGFGSGIANWAKTIAMDFSADVTELRRAIPRMRQCGTRLIRIMSYPNVKDNPWPRDRWRDEVIRRIRELARIAEGEGVILGHENCSGYGGLGSRETFEILDAVNSPALKLIFDTGNTTLHDGSREATWAFYKACRDRVVHVHIKACKPDPEGKWITCYPDEDEVQRRVLADLKAREFDGWISIEPHMAAAVHEGKGVSDARAAAGIYVEYARRLGLIVQGL